MFLQVAIAKEECRYSVSYGVIILKTASESLSTTGSCLGQKNSPTCANYGFQQRGRDKKIDFPPAASTIVRTFYMDDLVKSLDSLQADITCYQELIEILKRSGFTIKQWASSCPEVLEIIPVDDRLEANEFTFNAESSSILVLSG